jgi:hypothetical protein
VEDVRKLVDDVDFTGDADISALTPDWSSCCNREISPWAAARRSSLDLLDVNETTMRSAARLNTCATVPTTPRAAATARYRPSN